MDPQQHPGTPVGSWSVTLAVCAEMVFLDLPIGERVRRIADLGFQVEIWDWTTKDLDALAGSGAVFSSMTGYVTGTLTDDQGAAELLASAERSIAVAERLGCPRLNLHGTGLDPRACRCGPCTRSPGPCGWPRPGPWSGWPPWGSGPG
jgi:hydroxypyruvate isomerase